ncbi:MAG: hypothetical protein HQM11_14460 [SAR324 cluster bacterium]|nr:hypothetical protein [SAR324 cluster bacterium]
MDKQLLENLSAEAKTWLAHAIAGMISADGVVDKSEMVFLRDAIGFMENVEDVNALVNMVKAKEKPELQNLKIDRKNAFLIYCELGRLAVVDQKLSVPEVEFLKYAGSKLGFPEMFCNELVKWAYELMSVLKQETQLMYQAEKMPPVYKK